MRKSILDIDDIIQEYNIHKSIHKVANKFHTSHIRISNLLKENGVKINNVGKKKDFSVDVINDMIGDYVINHMTTEEISKKYGIRIKRLRQIFRENNVKVSRWNGHVIKEKTIKVKKNINECEYKACPYCEWKTKDVLNKSHAYQKHLLNFHKINIDEHLLNYPQDIYFLKSVKGKIKCKICNKYLYLIDQRHLNKHNITKQEYIEKYGSDNIISETTKLKLNNCILKMYENDHWDRKSSSYETFIQNFLKNNHVNFTTHDRRVLNGLEIDIFIEDKNIGIEFHGLKHHTEWFGRKKHNYHLRKTIDCNNKGVKLLQIFEDEFIKNKDLILNKLQHSLHINEDLPKIMGRKCVAKPINKEFAKEFLNIYHIQGFASSTVYLGAFYEDKLIAVMTFKVDSKTSSKWELNRFASDYNYICQGVGGKLFKWFIKNYNPSEIKSFADRRWTLDKDNNLYTKLGFKLEKVMKPDYRYYNEKVEKYTRFHKFNFRKNILNKKYGLPLTMTETEMAKELGYDRIWDCGLFKFVWKREE